MALKIASLNVRGLRDNTKRREMFTWFRTKHFSMYMLQEVHYTENINHVWSAEWGYQAIFSNYKSNKAGVCILFNKTLIFKLKRLSLTPKGVSLFAILRAAPRKYRPNLEIAKKSNFYKLAQNEALRALVAKILF